VRPTRTGEQRVEPDGHGREGATPARPLAEVAAAVKRHEGSVTELFETFLRSQLFLVRPPEPGFHWIEVQGRQLVPVFSSEFELARFAGSTDWFSTDGLDLLGLLPPGFVLGLDVASPHRLELNPAAVRLERAEAPRHGSSAAPAAQAPRRRGSAQTDARRRARGNARPGGRRDEQ
jgi:hypothetical protein